MPDNDVWPPKPDLPDPLTEYDEMIVANLAAFPAGEPAQMRFRLIKALREEGLDMRQAIAIVNDYCDRHGVLVRSKATQLFAWSNFGLVLAAMLLSIFNVYLGNQRAAILLLPHHHTAFLALRREQLAIVCAITALAFLNMIVLIIRFRRNRQK